MCISDTINNLVTAFVHIDRMAIRGLLVTFVRTICRVFIVRKTPAIRLFSVLAFCLVFALSTASLQAKEKEQNSGDAGPSYIEMTWLTAPLVHKGIVRGYIIFDLKLLVGSQGEVEEVMVQMPRLRDAFLRTLNKGSITRKDGSGALDFEAISQLLKRSANTILGEEKVNQVLIVKAVRTAA